jgi:hypothetical protein
MPAPHTHWWASRDLRRLVARCEFTNGKVIQEEELRYLGWTAEALLNGPLYLDDDDRAQVLAIYHTVRLALAEESIRPERSSKVAQQG